MSDYSKAWVYQDYGMASNSCMSNKNSNYGKFIIVENVGDGRLNYLSGYFNTEEDAERELQKLKSIGEKQ